MTPVIEAEVVPSLRVMFLGFSRSGKTTFQTVQDHELGIVSARRPFTLRFRGHPTLGKALRENYDRLTVKNDWLSQTRGDISRFEYDCYVNNTRLLVTTFIDYPGENLRSSHRRLMTEEKLAEISDEIRSADAIVVLIDGEVVVDIVKHGANSSLVTTFGQELDTLLEYVSSMDSLGPLHFMLTKWDHCQHEQVSLPQIRDLLLDQRHVVDVIETRTAVGSPVRLIPVSAFGTGFVQPRNWMERRLRGGLFKFKPGARPEPINIEVPLALAFIDHVSTRRQAVERFGRSLQAPSDRETHLTFWERVRVAAAGAFRFGGEHYEEIATITSGVAVLLQLLSRDGNAPRDVTRPNTRQLQEAAEVAMGGLAVLSPEAKQRFEEATHNLADRLERGINIRVDEARQQYQEALETFQQLVSYQRASQGKYQQAETVFKDIVNTFGERYPGADLTRSLPALAALEAPDARLSLPDWHPSD